MQSNAKTTEETEGVPAPPPFAGHDVIVVGGSRGSLSPLRQLLSKLPTNLPASVFVVQHRGQSKVRLAELIQAHCALKVSMAEDGAEFQRSMVYLAPHDRHLVLVDGKTRVLPGPRENLARPSIDMLFRSAAVDFGSRVIGVVLSGAMNDGEAGLHAIRRCGGVAMVQDPAEAEDPELPRRALEGGVDHTAKSGELGELVTRIVSSAAKPARRTPEDLALDARAAMASLVVPARVTSYGEPAHLTCPECMGPLFRAQHGADEQYRCDVGHAFTATALLRGQSAELERALWIAYRTLLERTRTIERLMEGAHVRGRPGSALSFDDRLQELQSHAESVRRVLAAIQVRENESEPSGEDP